MQSRHRVIPLDAAPTDGAGEIELPEDLAEVAEQLRLDAAHLAACYPADVCESRSRARRGPRWRRPLLAGWLIAAGGAAAVVLLMFALQHRPESVSAPVAPPRLAASPFSLPSKSDGRFASQRPGAGLRAKAERAPREPAVDLEPVSLDQTGSAIFLRDVSGPELEGLLDLWDDQSAPSNRVSI